MDDVRLFMNRGADSKRPSTCFPSAHPRRVRRGCGLVLSLKRRYREGPRRSPPSDAFQLAADALVQKSTTAACASAIATLGKNADDVPFALLYLVDGDRATLQQAVGAEAGAVGAPLSFAPDGEIGSALQRTIVRVLRSGRSRATGSSAVGYAAAPRGRPAGRTRDRSAGRRPGTGPALGGPRRRRKPDPTATTPSTQRFSNSSPPTSAMPCKTRAPSRRNAGVWRCLPEMDRAKTLFFSNVSHEFRTPLTLMLGPLERLSKTDDERGALAKTARRNALRLLKLVNTLLEFARLEAGRTDAVVYADRSRSPNAGRREQFPLRNRRRRAAVRRRDAAGRAGLRGPLDDRSAFY